MTKRRKGSGGQPRSEGAVFVVRDVLAVGMRNGRCPVGVVTGVSDQFLTMDLFDWLVGSFCGSTVTIAVSEIVQVMRAEKMTHDHARSHGWVVHPSETWFDMDPLAAFQTQWWQMKEASQ